MKTDLQRHHELSLVFGRMSHPELVALCGTKTMQVDSMAVEIQNRNDKLSKINKQYSELIKANQELKKSIKQTDLKELNGKIKDLENRIERYKNVWSINCTLKDKCSLLERTLMQYRYKLSKYKQES